jgi:hypothetical protein
MTDDEDRPTLRREWKGDADEDAHAGPLFAPDEVETTRLRLQGVGLGAEELRLQRDPSGSTTSGETRERTNTAAEEESDAQAAGRVDPRH